MAGMPEEKAAGGRGAVGIHQRHRGSGAAEILETAGAAQQRGFQIKAFGQVERKHRRAGLVLAKKKARAAASHFQRFRAHPDQAAIGRHERLSAAQEEDQHILPLDRGFKPGIIMAPVGRAVDRPGGEGHIVRIRHRGGP